MKDGLHLRETLLSGFVFPGHTGSDNVKATKSNIKGRTKIDTAGKGQISWKISGLLVISGRSFFLPSFSRKN